MRNRKGTIAGRKIIFPHDCGFDLVIDGYEHIAVGISNVRAGLQKMMFRVSYRKYMKVLRLLKKAGVPVF